MADDREIHIHVHIPPAAADPRIDEILSTVARIEMRGAIMAADLSRITTEVAEAGTVIDSAVALINGMAGQIRDLATRLEQEQGVDVTAVNALADSLDQKGNELAAAVASNTPAVEEEPEPEAPVEEPTPEPEPVPVEEVPVTEEPAPVEDPAPVEPAEGAVDGGLVDAGTSADVQSSDAVASEAGDAENITPTA